MKQLILPLVAFIIALPAGAQAMDCVPAEVTEQTVEQADLIFEGIVREEALPADPADTSDTVRNATYHFTINKFWKGGLDGAKDLLVTRNIYWGDNLTVDAPYLVFADKTGDGYQAPLCGNTAPLNMAQDKLEQLQNILGEQTKGQ
jgi:hypothetical protein